MLMSFPVGLTHWDSRAGFVVPCSVLKTSNAVKAAFHQAYPPRQFPNNLTTSHAVKFPVLPPL